MALPTRARSARLLVVALVSASLVTITVDYREGDRGPLATLGRGALAGISPLQEAMSKITHPIGNFFSTLVHLPSIRAENERLKTLVQELEAARAISASDEARLHELEKLLEVTQSLGPNVRTTAAQVIASGVSNFEWSVTINKGSADGIKPGMAVVAAGKNLVGHVIRVAPNSSMVELIADPDSAVAGRLQLSGSTGLITGQGEQDMKMDLVDVNTEVQAGEQVVTAGYTIPGVAQSLYPPGVLIGTVSRVVPQPAALEKFITVAPAVDFSSLDIVLVVLSDGSR
jgi:rod shape-determining protein MreC